MKYSVIILVKENEVSFARKVSIDLTKVSKMRAYEVARKAANRAYPTANYIEIIPIQWIEGFNVLESDYNLE